MQELKRRRGFEGALSEFDNFGLQGKGTGVTRSSKAGRVESPEFAIVFALKRHIQCQLAACLIQK